MIYVQHSTLGRPSMHAQSRRPKNVPDETYITGGIFIKSIKFGSKLICFFLLRYHYTVVIQMTMTMTNFGRYVVGKT